MLPQDPDNLLFRKPPHLHRLSPLLGQTLIENGGILQGQVRASHMAKPSDYLNKWKHLSYLIRRDNVFHSYVDSL
jgi:hypothetical protein